MNSTITIYGRTYELDFSQEGSVLLTYKSNGYTTNARVGIKTNEFGIDYPCRSDLTLAAGKSIGKRAQSMIMARLNGVINNRRLERIAKEKAEQKAKEELEMESTTNRIEEFESTAFHTYNRESKWTADTSLVTKSMIDVMFERHAPFTDSELKQVLAVIAKVVDTQTKRFV